MKILLVSRYAEPKIRNANSNVFRQAHTLKAACKLDVEVLTWPFNDFWAGPVAPARTDGKGSIIEIESAGLKYHVIGAPTSWNSRPMDNSSWESACAFGEEVLIKIRPTIVHVHHWTGMWWMLEAAQRSKIKTVYTNHDWGIACLRTVLVKGDKSLCDGVVGVDKCSQCITNGRGLVGRANEWLVASKAGRSLMRGLERSPAAKTLQRKGAVFAPVNERVSLNLQRATKCIANLEAMITPSQFGRRFFNRLGVPDDRVHVLPWYADKLQQSKAAPNKNMFIATYIGRVSPEKGVHLIFDAMRLVRSKEPIHLRIAGANDSVYCRKLRQRFGHQVGEHTVEWISWADPSVLYATTDIVLMPSQWIDNTPLVLIESLANKVPVVCSRIPTVEELIKDGETGYFAEVGSPVAFALAIERAVSSKSKVQSTLIEFPEMMSCEEYCRRISNIYHACR